MPYVDPKDANNRLVDSVQAIKQRNGDGLWRERVTASPQERVLLHSWPPGHSNPPHYHPEVEEIFVIHEGRAEFDFGEGRVELAEPGAVLYTPVRQPHAIRVVGDERLLMMTFLAPNVPDDEVAC